MRGRVSRPWKKPLKSANVWSIPTSVGFLKPGMTAAELYDMYTSFGDDPFIVRIDPNDPIHFSAWDYAKERSNDLTASHEAISKTELPVASDATAREGPKSGQGIIIVGAKPFDSKT